MDCAVCQDVFAKFIEAVSYTHLLEQVLNLVMFIKIDARIDGLTGEDRLGVAAVSYTHLFSG